jgi:hypothetical protein
MRFSSYQLSRILLLALAISLPGAVHAALLLRVEQIGSDVVVSGSGSANLTDLTSEGFDGLWTNYLTDAEIYAGPNAFNNGFVSLYSGITGPSLFGSDPGVLEVPDAVGSGGDLFGFQAASASSIGANQLVLPISYVSGASLSGSTTFSNRTIAQLGLTPGQVTTWSWGSGTSADSLRLEVVPAPAPLLGGLAALRMARSLRRRHRARSTGHVSNP